MARARDELPARQADPLWRARTYVDRRTGMSDPAATRRALRSVARSPRPTR